MGQCAVFIDGGYFEKLQQDILGRAKVDFQKLVHILAKPDSLFRTYYYHCLPHQSAQPTPEEANVMPDDAGSMMRSTVSSGSKSDLADLPFVGLTIRDDPYSNKSS